MQSFYYITDPGIMWTQSILLQFSNVKTFATYVDDVSNRYANQKIRKAQN